MPNQNAIKANDTINGKMGHVLAIIDGTYEPVLGVKKFSMKAAVSKGDVSQVGTSVEQKKVKGMSYAGDITYYYGTPLFTKIATAYKKTGKMPELVMICENDDPQSSYGKQRVSVQGILLDEIPIALLDESSSSMEGTVNFTASDYDMLESFNDQPDSLF